MNSKDQSQSKGVQREGEWVLVFYCYLPEEFSDDNSIQRVNVTLKFLRKSFTYRIFYLDGEELISPEQTRAVYIWKFQPKKQEEAK